MLHPLFAIPSTEQKNQGYSLCNQRHNDRLAKVCVVIFRYGKICRTLVNILTVYCVMIKPRTGFSCGFKEKKRVGPQKHSLAKCYPTIKKANQVSNIRASFGTPFIIITG